jgi:hypothetical protein
MLKRVHLITSGLILGWYMFAAAAGWKGWVPAMVGGPGFHSGSSGGRGSITSGGWGGGK